MSCCHLDHLGRHLPCLFGRTVDNRFIAKLLDRLIQARVLGKSGGHHQAHGRRGRIGKILDKGLAHRLRELVAVGQNDQSELSPHGKGVEGGDDIVDLRVFGHIALIEVELDHA